MGKSSAWRVRAGHTSSFALQTGSVNTAFCNLLKRLFSQSQERIKPAHWSISVVFYSSNFHVSQKKFSPVNVMDFFVSFWTGFLLLTISKYCSLTLDLKGVTFLIWAVVLFSENWNKCCVCFCTSLNSFKTIPGWYIFRNNGSLLGKQLLFWYMGELVVFLF